MKLLPETSIRKIIDNTIDEWKKRCPDMSLDDYDNWKTDVVVSIVAWMNKKNDGSTVVEPDTLKHKEDAP